MGPAQEVEVAPERLEGESGDWGLCLFDDQQIGQFHPLTWTRPGAELRCGLFSFAERIERQLLHRIDLLITDSHLASYRPMGKDRSGPPVNLPELLQDGPVLFLYGPQVLPAEFTFTEEMAKEGAIFLQDSELIGFALPEAPSGGWQVGEIREATVETVEQWAGRSLPHHVLSSLVFRWPWELVRENDRMIREDYDAVRPEGELAGSVHSRATILEPGAVYMGSGVEVGAYTVLDAREGPIWIGPDVQIQPFSYLQGPVVVGEGTIVMSATLRTGTSVGPFCRVAGEVGDIIIHGYSNKAHYGYIGHSYIGEWVNLGAGTTTSDLKNNYGEVRMIIDDEPRSTGMMKMGSIISDHVKTAIGSLLPSGGVSGVGSNLWSEGGFLPKYVPPFIWGVGSNAAEYDLDRFLQTARAVMGRRAVEMGTEDEILLQGVFELTAEERRRFLAVAKEGE